jgi:hypothetical protein
LPFYSDFLLTFTLMSIILVWIDRIALQIGLDRCKVLLPEKSSKRMPINQYWGGPRWKAFDKHMEY